MDYYNDNELYLKNQIARHGSLYDEVMLSLVDGMNSRIIDVGCGDGTMTERLKKGGNDVTGVDASEIALRLSKERGVNVVWGNIEKGILPKDKFDVVWCQEVIEHLLYHEEAVKNLNRLLNVGGTLVLSTPNNNYYRRWIRKVLGKTCTELDQVTHIRYFSFKSLKKLLEENGFEVVYAFKRRGLMLFSMNLVVKARKRCDV